MKNKLTQIAVVGLASAALLGSGVGIASAAPAQQSGTAVVAQPTDHCSFWERITSQCF